MHAQVSLTGQAGVALAMTAGSPAVSKDSLPVFNDLLVYETEVVPWTKNLTDACIEDGYAVMIQLTHLGRHITWNKGDWLPSMASSRHRKPDHHHSPKLIEEWDIDRIAFDFTVVVKRMQAC